MANRLASPIDVLLDGVASGGRTEAFDAVIVGSGYGGSVAAMRLAGNGRRVAVLERGREYVPGEFPQDLGDVPGHVRFQRPTQQRPVGNPDALFDFRIGEHVDVLVGCGLGGTSLINANVAVKAERLVLGDKAWPEAIRNDPAILDPHYDAVAAVLDTRPAPAGAGYAKLAALQTLARTLEASCEAAPLTVTFAAAASAGNPVANSVGIAQNPCTGCGNCVSGCNVGAKNTLAMNLLPLARARGAILYTGATAISVVRNDADATGEQPWLVRIRRTLSEKTPLDGEVFHIPTRNVVLAAGTLGSTEILLRSTEGGLEFSGELGKHFSGNGDALAVGYGQAAPVRAIGTADAFGARHAVGPTIVGMAKRPRGAGERPALTIEDGAIPSALRRVFGEIAATGALFQRLVDRTLPAWHAQRPASDPLAASDACLDHAQVLLIMGDDGAGGVLRLQEADGALYETPPDHARAIVDWPNAGENPALLATDEALREEDRGTGFDGGQYVPNPAWRLLPAGATEVMSGKPLGGRVMTVHPLGGCAMGDDAATGVVDDAGRVYAAASGNARHRGLYVLDGAIVPRALGVNPFLTIAALAHRGAGAILADNGWTESTVAQAPDHGNGTPAAPATVPPRSMRLRFKEKLCGRLDTVPGWFAGTEPERTRLGEPCGFVLNVEMSTRDPDQPVHAGERDLDAWLQAPGAEPVLAKVSVYANPLDAGQVDRWKMVSVPDEHLLGQKPLYEGEGRVTLLAVDHPGPGQLAVRALKAIWAFHRRRQSLLSFTGPRRRERASRGDRGKAPGEGRGIREKICGFMNLACLHAHYRRLTYNLELRPTAGGDAITIRGEKVLAWATDQPRLWDALCNLDIVVRNRRTGRRATGRLAVDLGYLATKGIPQIHGSPHTPATIAAMIGAGGFFLRAILQTSLWDFGGPDYPAAAVPRDPRSGPIRTRSGDIAPEVTELAVPTSKADPREIRLVLTRYRHRDSRAHPPVLLVHGLAQGGLIFSTRSLETGMASYFWDAGYEVWLLDHRISNALPAPVPGGGWGIEEIGLHDIPAAVKHVYEAAGGATPVRLFAHCVGATAVQVAILSGELAPANRYLHSVAFNAIHPWIAASPVNDFKGKLGAFFRDVVGSDPLDPIPSPNPSATESVIDRLAFSLARFGEEAKEGHSVDSAYPIADAVCDRMTFYYGRMWRHGNLDPRTHASFPSLVGLAHIDVYRQLYYFTQRGRVTTREGVNSFLTDDNIRKHWSVPTLFLHGELSKVFNPQSATRSAIRLAAVLEHYGVAGVPVRVKRIPGYGHMDVVFAESACESVYPVLASFFRNPADGAPFEEPDPGDDPHRFAQFSPSCGPVLRDAARAADGKVDLRLWTELREEVTTNIRGAALHQESKGIRATARSRLPVFEPRYAMLDATADASGDVEYAVGPCFEGSAIDTDPGLGSGLGNPGAGASGIAGGMPHLMMASPSVDGPSPVPMAGLPPCDPEASAPGRAPPPPWPAHRAISYPRTRPWLARLRAGAPAPGTADAMRFLVGSCRYPGSPFERDEADAVFAGMLPHIEGTAGKLPGVDRLLLIGDQIYADATADAFDTLPWRERYSERYRDAFAARNLARVLAQVPTHFAIDDHEIGDNWSGLPAASHPQYKKRYEELDQALGSARSFQHRGGAERAMWHALDHRGAGLCPTFIMDTRSERELRTAGDRAAHAMVSEEQIQALEAWLGNLPREDANRPKLIVCGVGIAPVSREYLACPESWRNQDGWLGYPRTLERVASMLLRGVRNVIFVSGDLHLSALSRLEFSAGGKSAVAWHVVSSGLYAPLPFANAHPADYEWNRDILVPLAPAPAGVALATRSGLLCNGPAHFLRVDLEGGGDGGSWKLAVRVVDRSGAVVAPHGSPPQGAAARGDAWTADLA